MAADPAVEAVLRERDTLHRLLERVRVEHPLVSAYTLEHLYAAAVRDHLDSPEDSA